MTIRWKTIMLGLLLIIGIAVLAAPVGAQSVDPLTVGITLFPGGTQDIAKTATTPTLPKDLDLLLLEDETGSFDDDIATMQGTLPDCSNGKAAEIWDGIKPQVDSLHGGVAGFRDFAQDGWGIADQDWVYRRIDDLTSDKATWLSGVCQLTAVPGAGNDEPEAQLAALKSGADGAAWDSNGNGVFTDAIDTPAGQGASWRSQATHVIMLVTDAPYHVNGDSGGWPGPTYADTITELANENVHVIILIAPNPGGDYTSVAADTGGSVKPISTDSADIVAATLAALEELKTDVWWEVTSVDTGITVSLTPTVVTQVPGNTPVAFTETVSVPMITDPGTYHATVTFFANSYPTSGSVLGIQQITVEVIPVPATIDIKPGSFPNSINLGNKGVIPVGLLGSATFDVTTVDPTTLFFAFPGGTSPQHWAFEDVNGDGFMDIISQYNTQASGIAPTDTSACLRGKFTDGVTFQGCDSVRIVPPK